MVARRLSQLLFVSVLAGCCAVHAQVTLTPATAPTSGQAGVTSINITGSGFPAGTILPASTDVRLEPAAGGAFVTTKATAVTTVVGTTRRVTFLIPSSISVAAPAGYLVSVSGTTSTAVLFTSTNKSALTINPPARISAINPPSGQAGQSLTVTITGQLTNFVQSSTQASFGAGIAVGGAAEGAFGPVTVTSPSTANAQLQINAAGVAGPRDVTVRTGVQQATAIGGFTVGVTNPTISGFSPPSAPAGTLVTLTGTNLTPNPQVTLNKQGGGTIAAPVATSASTSLAFTIPTGAATGAITVTVNTRSAASTSPLTIVAASDFTLSALPAAADLIRGQSASYAVKLASSNGFGQLAALSVSGVPTGIAASFKPPQITAGQTSVLTLAAPAGQAVGSANLTVSASATVEGIPLSQSATAQVNVVTPTTSLIGRTVVDDPLQTPLAGVTVKMLGKDGSGGTTGCTGSTVSDAAGNFILRNLAGNCVGRQLIGYDGLTATSPPGKYAGVNLVYTLASGQVTASPVLVHLPRIDLLETFNIQQNSAQDQPYSFASIPGLSLMVYKGTTFTMPDGTRPNPFPLVAAQVPVDRLPDAKPPVPTMMLIFIVAFQPANVKASQPVAVSYPNIVRTAPGTNMPLLTLDPTRGSMIPYGTGTVSPDGTQIVPDSDPAFPGHRYGIVDFDWHGQMPPPTPPNFDPPPYEPCPRDSCCLDDSIRSDFPVYFSSGVETYKKTDISFGGSRGTVSIVRSFRTLSNNGGPFGVGGSHNYGYSLDSLTPGTATLINLVAPDYHFFPFTRQLDGTLRNTTDPSMLGAVMTTNGNSASLRWKDGTVFQFTLPGALFPLLESITDPNRNTISLTRNGVQITRITDPVGRSLVLTYDGQNRITSITDPIGRTVAYTYNSFNTLATVTDPAGGLTSYNYASAKQLLWESDPRGVIVVNNVYDAAGRVILQKQADNGITTIAYTLANPLAPTSPVIDTVVSDPLGRQTAYRFSVPGFLTNSTDAIGQPRTFDRSAQNLVTAAKGNGQSPGCGSPAGGDTSSTYDPATGNQLSQTDALGNTTRYTYEPVFGKVTTITDPAGSVSKFSYDTLGNLISSTDANNNMTAYAYDSFGQLIQTTDPLGQVTKFAYDAFGNLISITDPLQNKTQFRYDAISRQTEVLDPLGRRTNTAYDKLGRVTMQTDAKGGVTAFQYDGVGNVLSVTDARGKKTTFTYDGMNRLLTRTTPLGKTESRTYDLRGNLVRFVDRRGQTSMFAYDQLDRLITETYQDSTVSRQYDAAGRLVKVDDSAVGTFTNQYDPVGRLITAASPFGTVQYLRDALGRVKARQVVGQSPVTYAYDPAGNLLSAAMPQASVNYTYNARNQPSTMSRMNGVGTQYSYDPAGRLLSILHARGQTPLVTLNYSSDAASQRTSVQNTTAQALITQAAATTYNDGNQLVTRGAASFNYDANGNLLSQSDTSGTTTYTWDSRDRLVLISASNGQTTTLVYDPSRNLMQQKDVGPAINLTQTFVLDQITNVAYQSRSDGDHSSILTGQVIDEHLGMVRANGQVTYGIPDAINSTIATSNVTGSIASSYAYEPFGGKSILSGGDYAFSFTGRTSVGGLYYLRNRFFDPKNERFVSEDPLGYGGGDTNLYRYVGNTPVSRRDPLGEAPEDYEGPIGQPQPYHPRPGRYSWNDQSGFDPWNDYWHRERERSLPGFEELFRRLEPIHDFWLNFPLVTSVDLEEWEGLDEWPSTKKLCDISDRPSPRRDKNNQKTRNKRSGRRR